jgi:hypothetical protein
MGKKLTIQLNGYSVEYDFDEYTATIDGSSRPVTDQERLVIDATKEADATNGSGVLFVGAPTGPTGSTGPTGETGSAGSQGAAGSTGPTGWTGWTGPQGSEGSQGSQGAAGSTGPTGWTGSQGGSGTAGATGPTGANTSATTILTLGGIATLSQKTYSAKLPVDQNYTLVSMTIACTSGTNNVNFQVLKNGSAWGSAQTLTGGNGYQTFSLNLTGGLANDYLQIQVSSTITGTAPTNVTVAFKIALL